jgi:hypothetical protein
VSCGTDWDVIRKCICSGMCVLLITEGWRMLLLSLIAEYLRISWLVEKINFGGMCYVCQLSWDYLF